MNQFNMGKLVIQNILSMKQWLIGASIYSLFVCYCLILSAKLLVPVHTGIFDVIVHMQGRSGTTNEFMYVFLGIPITVTFLVQMVTNMEKNEMVLKYTSRFHLWNIQITIGILFSFAFAFLLIVLSLILSQLIVGTHHTWNSMDGSFYRNIGNKDIFQQALPNITFWRIIVTIFLKVFLGTLLLSVCTLFLRQFMKQNILVLLTLVALASLDLTQYFSYPFFTRSMSSDVMSWVHPMTSLYHGIYVLVICGILYAITGWLYERKDFLS